MKEFSCEKLGHKCSVVLKAPTEERLADMVSLHLREAHGVISLSPQDVAKIKNLFINRTAPDAAAVVDSIFEKYNCNGEPECTWRYIAEAEMILNNSRTARQRELKAA